MWLADVGLMAFVRFGRVTPILGRSVLWLNSAKGLDLENGTGESR